MAKWHVVYELICERTYEIEAPDEDTAIANARAHGTIINESEDSCDLSHVEQLESAP